MGTFNASAVTYQWFFVSHCVLRGLWGFLFYLGAAVVASEDDDFIGRHAEDR